MNKKGKNRKQKRKEQKKFQLGEEISDLPKENKTVRVKQSFSIDSKLPDYDEKLNENLLISFIHYNSNVCGLRKLAKNDAKKLIKKLKVINDTKIKDLPSSKLIRGDVNNSGEYKKLFKNFTFDIEIKEIEFSRSGRIFAHFIGRYVCIVAIDPIHKNIK